MASRYGRGAIVLRKPPSFLEGLLGGMGTGVTQGVERVLREREARRERAARVVEHFLSGKFPIGMAGTDLFQDWVDTAKLRHEPGIQALISAGQEPWRPEPHIEEMPSGAVVEVPQPAPENVPYEYARRRLGEAEAAKELNKLQRELIVRKQIDRLFEKPLEERLRGLWEIYQRNEDLPIESLSTTGPDGERITLKTQLQNDEDRQATKASQTREGRTFEKEKIKYFDMQLGIIKAMHNAATDRDITAGFGTEMLKMFGEYLGGTELEDKDKIKILRTNIPLWNEKIRSQLRVLHKTKNLAKDESLTIPPYWTYRVSDVKDLGTLEGRLDVITTIKDRVIQKLEGEPEPPEPLKESELRTATILPKVSEEEEEAIDPSEVSLSEAYIINADGEKMVLRNGKWVKVKKK